MNDIILYDYDKDFIKENLSIDQIETLVADLGGEPISQPGVLLCLTICHGGDSHKLYYYENTYLFHCFTGCSEPTFDIFELVRKVKSRETQIDWDLPKAIDYVARYFGYAPKERTTEEQIQNLADWKILNNYDRIKDINIKTQEVDLKTYEGQFLKNLPRPIILPWIKDNISKEVMDNWEICYNPKSEAIVIPHRDINNNLIGIRERTLILENIELYGKYRPAYIMGKLYNHPLSYNLYGINKNKDTIKKLKKAIIFESEKSVLQYETMFGKDVNIALACCGSAFVSYQAWMLINLGIEEIIVALDRQFQEINDKEHIKLVKNLTNIHKKYGNYVKISFIFDKNMITSYKASPTDEGKDKFLTLFKERVNLY